MAGPAPLEQGCGLAAENEGTRRGSATRPWLAASPRVVGQGSAAQMRKRERPDGAEGEGERMGSYVLGLREIDQTQVEVVGGKGAHLGELARIEGRSHRLHDVEIVGAEHLRHRVGLVCPDAMLARD